MSQPVEAFRNAFRIPELKQRIIFTLGMLAVYRLGCHIPTPGIDGGALAASLAGKGGLLGLSDMFTGGALQNATVFALGIMPYISASIIMQLLTAVVPQLEKIAKEGAEGQKKITEYTRYGTILLCLVQSWGIATMLVHMNQGSGPAIVPHPNLGYYLMCMLTFTTGTAFIMWLGEQISEYGVGNGMSLIIFIGIVSRMPHALARMGQMVLSTGEMSIFRAGILILIMVAVVAGVVVITVGQRRVPVQYPRQVRGTKVLGGGRSYLPLRVNQAGVIPIIFASSILMLPSMIGGAINIPIVQSFFNDHFHGGTLAYSITYGALIMFFCFFYTAITFNPVEMADNLKKYGGVIMGVRPGRTTADYLQNVMTRITLVGSVFLVAVALIPNVINYAMQVNDWQIASFFGGTSLLILVGVALDTVRQIEQHLIMRNYDGFMKGGGRMRGRRL